jgi:hypothetical protein
MYLGSVRLLKPQHEMQCVEIHLIIDLSKDTVFKYSSERMISQKTQGREEPEKDVY